MAPHEIEKFIFVTAGACGISPWDFQFWQLVLLREGAEKERWERLSFQLATLASFVGTEKVQMSDFNKFDMQKADAPKIDTKSAMGSMKHMFPKK